MATVTMYRGKHPFAEQGMIAIMGDYVCLSDDDGEDEPWLDPISATGFEHPLIWEWCRKDGLPEGLLDGLTPIWTHDYEGVDIKNLKIV